MKKHETFCERCGEMLYQENTIWLEFNAATNTYHKPGTVPEEQSQGIFPFGRGCVAVMNAKTKNAQTEAAEIGREIADAGYDDVMPTCKRGMVYALINVKADPEIVAAAIAKARGE